MKTGCFQAIALIACLLIQTFASAQGVGEAFSTVNDENETPTSGTNTQDGLITVGADDDSPVPTKTNLSILLSEPDTSTSKQTTSSPDDGDIPQLIPAFSTKFTGTYPDTSSIFSTTESHAETNSDTTGISNNQNKGSKTSSGKTIGLAVGVSVGVLMILGGFVIWYLLMKKKPSRHRKAAVVTTAADIGGVENDANDVDDLFAIGGIDEPTSPMNIYGPVAGLANPHGALSASQESSGGGHVIQVNPYEQLPQYYELPGNQHTRTSTDEKDVKE
ncbi:hypothetical protein FB645_003697 [Coemansia sp. IMI 203386]|nr:hypothetical protein FB645_003697 [Coemansia sp. IMI 203386]